MKHPLFIPLALRRLVKEGYFLPEARLIVLTLYDDGDIIISHYFRKNLLELSRLATNRYIEVDFVFTTQVPTTGFGKRLKRISEEVYGTAQHRHHHLPLFEDSVSPWDQTTFETHTFSFFQQVAGYCSRILEPKEIYEEDYEF